MEFWSAGLGKKHLEINLGPTAHTIEGDELYMMGVMDAPAPWEYKVTLSVADWKHILTIATSPDGVKFMKSISLLSLVKLAIPIFKFAILLAFAKPSKVTEASAPAASK